MNKHTTTQADTSEKILRAESEEAAGRPWRAKEILGGCVGNLPYGLDHQLLAAYGALLDRLGDRYEAGKYLFLAGSNDPNHQDAIQLYLRRNKNITANELVSQFPGVIRHQGLGNLPATVQTDLERRGVPACELKRTAPRVEVANQDSRKATVLTLLFLSFLAASLVLWGVGLMTCISWFWSLAN